MYKGEFKIIDNEEKAYFLGFMYADGCLSKIKRKNSNYIKHQVQISLTDEDIIRRFKEIFPFFNLQIFDFGKYKSTWSKQFALRKANNELFYDLKDWGLLERKSSDNSNNLNFPEIDKKLVNHFLRGFFDGDGSISTPSLRPNLRRVEICSGSEKFLLEIKSILEENKVNCPIFREKNNNKSPLYVIEWVNSSDIVLLSDYLYKNATIFLERKKEKFDSINIIDRRDKNPRCIHCNNLTMSAGIREMKTRKMHRYRCVNCKKSFSLPVPLKSDELLENPEVDNQQPS